MRVADITLTGTYLSSINRTKEEIQKLQYQLSTNSRINKPSDDPSGMTRSLKLNEQLESNYTYRSNIDTSLSFLDATTSSLESILDEIDDIDVSLANLKNNINSGNKSTVAEQIMQSIKTMLSAANNEFEGKYVLGGTDFSEIPYGFTDSTETAVEMKVSSISGQAKIKISQSYTQQVNITGTDVFGDIDGTDIFNRLIQISQNLKNGTNVTDDDVNFVKSFRTKLIGKITNAGEVIVRLESTSDMLVNQNTQLQALLSKEKDLDAVAAVTELQNQQYFLERSYKVASEVLNNTLLDYF